MQGVGEGLDVEQVIPHAVHAGRVIATGIGEKKVMHLMRMFCLVLLALHVSQAAPQSISPVTPVGIEHENAIPVRTGLPLEPLPELKAGESIEIRVSGIVTKDGRLNRPEIVAPENAKRFVEALQAVLGDWRFQPAVDSDHCALKEKAQVFSVWFEPREGKTVMSVSSRISPDGEDLRKPDPKRGWKMGWESAPRVVFPWAALSRGMEGTANLLISVNSDGSLGNWNVLASDPHGIFAAASVAALLDAKFTSWEPAEGEKKTRCVVIPAQFCIGKTAKIPHRACKDVAE